MVTFSRAVLNFKDSTCQWLTELAKKVVETGQAITGLAWYETKQAKKHRRTCLFPLNRTILPPDTSVSAKKGRCTHPRSSGKRTSASRRDRVGRSFELGS
jgi:hypothetical protein